MKYHAVGLVARLLVSTSAFPSVDSGAVVASSLFPLATFVIRFSFPAFLKGLICPLSTTCEIAMWVHS